MNLIKWLHNRKHKYTPMCSCGYRMPFNKETIDRIYWKCKKCNWETYETGNGKLHWLKKSEKSEKKA